jgi:hypothetical protein
VNRGTYHDLGLRALYEIASGTTGKYDDGESADVYRFETTSWKNFRTVRRRTVCRQENSDTYHNLGLNKRGYVPTIRSADYHQLNAKKKYKNYPREDTIYASKGLYLRKCK